MDNRIRTISVRDGRLDPAGGEIWVTVFPEQLTSTTEVRGRLMGPRCRYSSTVEVAYPLREWSREYESEGVPRLSLRVIVPEASLWDPESPFLYEGPVELWQHGRRCDQAQLSHGLRSFKLGPRGLRWNARLLAIRGAARSACQEEDAVRLRRAGCNTLFAPVAANTIPFWESADRLGFLMLGRIANRDGMAEASDLRGHPSSLGWVLTSELLQDELVTAAPPGYLAHSGHLIGVELTQELSGPLPGWLQFLVCPEDLIASLTDICLPKIVLRGAQFRENGATNDAPVSGELLGYIFS